MAQVMALNGSEALKSGDTEYLELNYADAGIAVRIRRDTLDAIGRDVKQGFTASPEPVEAGGLLLGTVEKGSPDVVGIERYQRVECGHASGQGFILDAADLARLEATAAGILSGGKLAVVGLCRSHLRPGFQLEDPDFDLISRYFSDAADLILLIGRDNTRGSAGDDRDDLSAQLFMRGSDDRAGTGLPPAGPVLPFSGRASGGAATAAEPVPAESEAAEEPVRQRRLVPDFIPNVVEPARPQSGNAEESEPTSRQNLYMPRPANWWERLRNWWPLPAAALVVGALLWVFLNPGAHNTAVTLATPAAETLARPLGLFVDPAGEAWRVSWNPNATALHDARTVQLFVREGDDQNRVELSQHDLATGTYQYKPASNDVTFRLEVTEPTGRISSESFRFMRANAPAVAANPTPASPAATAPSRPGAPAAAAPRAIQKVAPQVPASIRPRITGAIPVDVKVEVDVRGRVVSAAPVTKHRSGLESYLAGRAVEAARQWRFEPARQNGKPVPGEQTLHFVFSK